MSKNINIKVNYKRKPDQVTQASDIQLSVDYICYAVSNVYKGGLESQWRRLWARVQRKLDDASDKNNGKISLEEGEYDFVKRALTEARFEPLLSKYVVLLEDAFDKADEKA